VPLPSPFRELITPERVVDSQQIVDRLLNTPSSKCNAIFIHRLGQNFRHLKSPIHSSSRFDTPARAFGDGHYLIFYDPPTYPSFPLFVLSFASLLSHNPSVALTVTLV
jgi:hypothetical protein